MRTKKSFAAFVVALLFAGLLIVPAAVSAYGGGIPPVVGIGPRIEQARMRLNEAHERLAARVRALRERIFSRFPGFPLGPA